MKIMCNVAGIVLTFAVAAGCGLAQGTTPEKHVWDIWAEQPRDVILASPLCQQTRERPSQSDVHTFQVDPSTLVMDLSSLMKQSDEVVLAGRPLESAEAISPSGKDAVEYFDIKVLRTWKGSHKVGDTLTFAITNASLRCGALTAKGTPTFSTINFDWKGLRFGVLVLFLRQSKGTEAQLNMGLRLTGGDGLQGAFSVALSVPSDEEMNCRGLDIQHGGLEKCNSFLEASENPVSVPYRRDPLLKKYDGMPIASFLQEVQSVADSLGATPQAESKNRANTQ